MYKACERIKEIGATLVFSRLQTSNQYSGLEYSYCIRAIRSERSLYFYRCTAENYRALVSRMLPSRQYFRALVNENERDAKFTRSDFKNKLRVLYFIHYNCLLICWEFTINAYPHSTKWRGRKNGFRLKRAANTSFLQTGFVNKWWRLFYRSSTSDMIEVRKYISPNGIFKTEIYTVKIYKGGNRDYDRIFFPNYKHWCEEQLNRRRLNFSQL